MLATRRALISAASDASRAYRAALEPYRGGMGLTDIDGASLPEYRAWRDAEKALAVFYETYPMKTYKREFAAESKAFRGR